MSSFVKHKQAYFDELLQVIHDTIWLVDPLGGRKDQMLSVMMGRPLAVVQAELGITFDGPLYHDQALAKMWVPQTPAESRCAGPRAMEADQRQRSPITSLSIPVRLGNVALRSEGLLGYFVDNNFDALFVTHLPADLQQPYSYIQPIYDPIEHKSSYISLPLNGKKVTVTMIIDPRGAVHAATGLLPVKEIALPVHPLEQFLRNLRLQFRAGPLLSNGE